MRIRSFIPRVFTDIRGVAAAEFALIAPALIFLIMGVFEMSFRFRASEEATRYVHQVADLISRETGLTTAQLEEIRNAAVFMMNPLDTTENLDIDVSSIGFEGSDADPAYLWRRVAGTPVTFNIEEAEGMGLENEAVIRVGVRYNYRSVLTDLFGGGFMAIERSAYARPRVERLVSLDGSTDDGGEIQYFGNN
ncbi:MAG TPA: pilus assembly protein [Hyphomonadaceae bacterium]|nr:pilus assembly protein [Hyphomonadaceae bacterium]HPI48008.1 pilus assembly protein [Hyphomonadaceae bacterium]